MQRMFSFVQHEVHLHLIYAGAQHALQQGALGLMVCGSVARGTAQLTSDLDLQFFWQESQPFGSASHADILVERHGHSIPQARALIERGGSHLYPWLEGKILHDPTGALAELKARAHDLRAMYRTPPRELSAVQHWLRTTLIKLEATPDETQCAFLIHTTTWKLAEGICAVNDCPVPPSTLMWEILPSLTKQPEHWLEPLLTGSFEERRDSFCRTISWLLDIRQQETSRV